MIIFFRSKFVRFFVQSLCLLFFAAGFFYFFCDSDISVKKNLILTVDQYNDSSLKGIFNIIYARIQKQPFNLIALFFFIGAIVHTFFAHRFTSLSKTIKERNVRNKHVPVNSFSVEILYLLGEVEVIFGIWAIPLMFVMVGMYDWPTTLDYIENVSYLEAMFVVVVMAVSSSGPIIECAEKVLSYIARLGGNSVGAWWWTILTLGPISGSFITEPGAMTISAFLLAQQFYEYKPRPVFAYATLGLLFTNISVGGVLTNFAAPPVLMVSNAWGWDTNHMFRYFGWKALLAILFSNTIYYFLFKKDLSQMSALQKTIDSQAFQKLASRTPIWITLTHLVFLAWIVVHNHHPVVFVGSFLLFLGFYQATLFYQKKIELKSAILVGFFLAGLVVHGNLQAWWLEPLLKEAEHGILLLSSIFLTSFNDNAAITFLATLVEGVDDMTKYAIVAGAVTGGGLTVIANAPNPTGQSILGKYFDESISSLYLFIAALLPTAVVGYIFYVLSGVGFIGDTP